MSMFIFIIQDIDRFDLLENGYSFQNYAFHSEF